MNWYIGRLKNGWNCWYYKVKASSEEEAYLNIARAWHRDHREEDISTWDLYDFRRSFIMLCIHVDMVEFDNIKEA